MYPIRPWLFIGAYRETLDENLLDSLGIGAVLQLADAVPYPKRRWLYLPVEDGKPISSQVLEKGVDFLRLARKDGQIALSACGAGISRSVTFAAAVLVEEESLSPAEALRQIRAVHPDGLPHPALWQSLCLHFGAPQPPDSYLALLGEL